METKRVIDSASPIWPVGRLALPTTLSILVHESSVYLGTFDYTLSGTQCDVQFKDVERRKLVDLKS